MKMIYQFTDVYYPLLGGVQSHIEVLVNNLPDYKFEILANAVPQNITKLNDNNIGIHYFSPVDKRYYPMKNKLLNKMLIPHRLLSDIIRYYNKKKYIGKENFDLLHVHGPAINMNFVGIDLRLNRCIFTRYSNFTYIKKPKVLTLHGLFSPNANYQFAKKYEEFLINQFDNIICVDENIFLYVMKYLQKTRQTKNVWYIPNSVDTNNFKYTPIPNKDKLQVGFVGRLERLNNTKLLLEFAKKMPSWVNLHIAGAGSGEDIEEFKCHLDLKRVSFYPNIKYEYIPNFFNDIDILLNPLVIEGISRVTLEAMSCGRPVIMLDKGNRYPIIHAKTGFLIKDDIDELLSLLENIKNNMNELKNIGKNARNIVEEEFSNEIIIPKINEIYKNLIK